MFVINWEGRLYFDLDLVWRKQLIIIQDKENSVVCGGNFKTLNAY